jgi:PilZ domain
MPESARSSRERRGGPRHKPRGRIRVSCHADPLGPNVARALVDLSEVGLRLLIKEPLVLGTHVALTIQRINHMVPVHCTGIVRWSLERDDGSCSVGVELHNRLDKESFARLTEGK